MLLLFSFVLDCTDGQLARYSLQYSTLGAWLDATFDRAKEYAYYAGLALGAARGGDDVWALALGAMVLQTCRHVVDFSFNEANHDATANTSPTAALSDKLDSVGWTVWVRRMIVLPIGERWAMIAVLTAVTTPRITFYVLLIGCAFAACYTTAGRVLRSLTRKAQPHRPGRAGAGRPRRLRPARRARRRRAAARPAPGTRPRPPAALGAPALLVGGAACSPPYGVLAGRSSRAVLYVLTSGRRRRRGPSRAPSTGWSRRSSGPPSTAPSWSLAAKRRRERSPCPRLSGWWRRSPTITTTRCTASAAAPARPRTGWCGRSAGTRGGPAGHASLAAVLTGTQTSPSR